MNNEPTTSAANNTNVSIDLNIFPPPHLCHDACYGAVVQCLIFINGLDIDMFSASIKYKVTRVIIYRIRSRTSLQR